MMKAVLYHSMCKWWVLARGWHSNMFCTPIFVLSQDESQGFITEIVDGQKSTYFCLDKGQSCILIKPQSELFVVHRIW